MIPVSEATTITLTGNPFVDTGLGVIAALGELDEPQQLTIGTIREVHGDGARLASWNARLKSFSQVFGTNNPLFQTGYGYKKATGPSSQNFAVYKGTLRAFLDALSTQGEGRRCEACGVACDFDFARACIGAVEALGGKPPEDKWIGRDWFPLAGSLGSDAQALPAASRTVHLCAKCLLAVQYLPLGVMLLDGQLSVFQSASVDLWYELVRDIADEVRSRVSAGNFDTLGAKEGTKAVVRRLLNVFVRLQRGSRTQGLPQGATLQVWRFSNAGASAKCGIEEIPNPALVFLWKAVGHGLRKEIEDLVAREGKRGRPLFRCIAEGRDYAGLYPAGRTQGASPKLFGLYQLEVCQRSPRALRLAHALAVEVSRQLNPKEKSRLQREGAFSEPAVRHRFRNYMYLMAQRQQFTLEDYIELFPLADEDSGFAVRFDGWSIIRYYLHHGDDASNIDEGSVPRTRTCSRLEVLRHFATALFSSYVGKSGKDSLQSDVLTRLRRGHIGVSWLKRQFVALAETHPGFTFGAFEDLCTSADGRPHVGEVLFQMRLLWTEWLGGAPAPMMRLPSLSDHSGLPRVVETTLQDAFTRYVQRRGLNRFHRDVLVRLRRDELGLSWFRRRLVSDNREPSELAVLSPDDWEDFLKDPEGRSNASARLFQMHLLLASLYRQFSHSQSWEELE